MAEIKQAKARELCSASELRLVEASRRQEIGQLSEAQLKRNVARARKLRDKWRDLAARQTRQVQQQQRSRVTDRNARSAEKQAIFDEVLARFEARLEKVSSGAAAPGTRQAAARPSKRKRTLRHRETRAAVRGALEEERARLAEESGSAASTKGARRKKAARKTAQGTVKKTAKKTAKKAAKKAAGKAAGKTAKKGGAKAVARKVSKKVVAPPPTEAAEKPLERSRQRKAATAGKQQRLQTSGVYSRVRGHVSARGRRSQSRRDSRG